MSDLPTTSNHTHDAVVVRLTSQLRMVTEQLAVLELEVLNSRDHAIGRANEIGELRHRLVAQAATYERRLHDAQAAHEVHDSNHRAHISQLEAALATASTAARVESRRATAAIAELADVRQSFTWRIGRLLMLPVRLAKRLIRRA